MTKLNQIIAVEPTVKNKAQADLTEFHRTLGKTALLSGITRTYQAKDEDGDQLPPESTLVQVNVEDVLTDVSGALARVFDVTLTKEVGNTEAKADVVVDGTTVLANVPVTYLLFLEKQLVNIHTFVTKLPTLDPASKWSKDENTGVYATDPSSTVRNKKIRKNHVMAEATDKHPAQVEVFHEDVLVGTWTKIDFSGAIPATRKRELTSRVEKLQSAVKFAREEANNHVVTDQFAGTKVFSYLFN